MESFKGKPPGSGSGEMSRRTQALRPLIALSKQQIDEARRLRRGGLSPDTIAAEINLPVAEIEKALLQMRTPRPESTRGTLNVTLAARRIVMAERKGSEPIWQTFDRIMDEWLRLRDGEGGSRTAKRRLHRPAGAAGPLLPGLS